MPTGYTCGVQDGTITDFCDYALQCARAFGACIMLRDEPMSNDIPEFTPSAYHADEAAKARLDLKELNSLNAVEIARRCDEEYDKAVACRKESLARIAEKRERYERMLSAAKSFVPPTSEHVELAKFMVSQLTDSIKWDCNTSYYDEPVKKLPIDWLRETRDRLEKSIAYHDEEHSKEVERTNGRNEWVRQLKNALDQQQKGTK